MEEKKYIPPTVQYFGAMDDFKPSTNEYIPPTAQNMRMEYSRGDTVYFVHPTTLREELGRIHEVQNIYAIIPNNDASSQLPILVNEVNIKRRAGGRRRRTQINKRRSRRRR